MVSKKGMLALDELIKLIIGIAVFIIIVVVIVMFIKIASNTIKEEQARNTLDSIVYKIEKANDNNKQLNLKISSFEFLVESPKNWVIIYNGSDQVCICDSDLLKGDMDSKSFLESSWDDGIRMEYEIRESCVRRGICERVFDSYISPSSCDGLLGFKVGPISSCFFLKEIPSNVRIIVGETIRDIVAPSTEGPFLFS